MKNHSRSGMKRGSLGFRTPSQFRFTSHLRSRNQKVVAKFEKKPGER